MTETSVSKDAPWTDRLKYSFFTYITLGDQLVSAWPVSTEFETGKFTRGLALFKLKSPHPESLGGISDSEIECSLAVLSFKTVDSVDCMMKWLQHIRDEMLKEVKGEPLHE